MNKSSKNFWQTRIELARQGWRSRVSVDPNRIYMSLKRDDWQGRVCCDITFSESMKLDRKTLDSNGLMELRSSIQNILDVLVARAEKAYVEYPTSVPCQVINGELANNQSETERAFSATGYRQDFRATPKEDIGEPNRYVMNNTYLLSLIEMVETGHYYEDYLTWYGMGTITAEDYASRKWTVEIRTQPLEWNSVKLSRTNPPKMRVNELHENSIAVTIRRFIEENRRAQKKYYPDSPHGDIPPQFKTLRQHEIDTWLECRDNFIARTHPTDLADEKTMIDIYLYMAERKKTNPDLADLELYSLERFQEMIKERIEGLENSSGFKR